MCVLLQPLPSNGDHLLLRDIHRFNRHVIPSTQFYCVAILFFLPLHVSIHLGHLQGKMLDVSGLYSVHYFKR
jgi:hypothetical protein